MYRQTFTLISLKDIGNKIPVKDLHFKVLQHELPEVDVTQGRGNPDKNTVFKSVSYQLFKDIYVFTIFYNNICML